MLKLQNTACFLLLLLFFPYQAHATDIATCGASTGYAYDAYRGLHEEESSGWGEDRIANGQFTLVKNEKGELDLLIAGALGVSSSVSDGATVIPATISDEAATIVLLYPNRLVETYVFQKLKNGKYQAMWTQAKAETPLPRITAFVSDCKYLNLSVLTNMSDSSK